MASGINKKTISIGAIVCGVICLTFSGGLYWFKDNKDEKSTTSGASTTTPSTAQSTTPTGQPVAQSTTPTGPQTPASSTSWLEFAKAPSVKSATTLMNACQKTALFDYMAKMDDQQKKTYLSFKNQSKENYENAKKGIKVIEEEYRPFFDQNVFPDDSTTFERNLLASSTYLFNPITTNKTCHVLGELMLACRGRFPNQAAGGVHHELTSEFRMNLGGLAFFLSFNRICLLIDTYGTENTWGPLTLIKHIFNILGLSISIIEKIPTFKFYKYETLLNEMRPLLLNEKLFCQDAGFRGDPIFSRELLDEDYLVNIISGFFTHKSVSSLDKQSYLLRSDCQLTYFINDDIKEQAGGWLELDSDTFKNIDPMGILIGYLTPDKLNQFQSKNYFDLIFKGVEYQLRSIIIKKKDNTLAFITYMDNNTAWFNFSDPKKDNIESSELKNLFNNYQEYNSDWYLFYERKGNEQNDVGQTAPPITRR